MRKTLVLIVAACVCVEWTRLAGQVKSINLRDSTLTIQNRDGDLLTIPIDYQVKIMEKHDEIRGLKNLVLDEKVVLTRIVSDKPKEEDGLQQPEPSQSGH